MSRSDDNYPIFVESTTVTGDFSVEYPVMYIKFFTCVEEGKYEPATLVITSDKKFYMLIDGAFYSLVGNDD